MLLQAQGVYQLWGMTADRKLNETGTIFKTDAKGNNFKKKFEFNTQYEENGIYPVGSLTEKDGKLFLVRHLRVVLKVTV